MNDENTKVVDEKVAGEEKEKQEIILITEETIQSKIYIVRGQKVMLDVDLAEIYGTGNLYADDCFARRISYKAKSGFDSNF